MVQFVKPTFKTKLKWKLDYYCKKYARNRMTHHYNLFNYFRNKLED